MLGPAGDPEALVTTDEPLGPIVALTELGDDRIAFVADTADGYRLYLLDDTSVRPVPPTLPRPTPSAPPTLDPWIGQPAGTAFP